MIEPLLVLFFKVLNTLGLLLAALYLVDIETDGDIDLPHLKGEISSEKLRILGEKMRALIRKAVKEYRSKAVW